MKKKTIALPLTAAMITLTPSYRVLPDGTVRQVYFYCVDISEFSERNTPFTGCPAKGVFVFLRLFGRSGLL